MTWRYVMTREVFPDGENRFTIRELYTSEDGALSWTENPVGPAGPTWLNGADDLAKMLRAIGSPILDLAADPPELVSPLDPRWRPS